MRWRQQPRIMLRRAFITILFYSTVYNAVEDLFLAYQIEDQDRNQGQQVRCKGQVVVCAELGLEVQLCQRQCVYIGSGKDKQRGHNVVPGTQSSENCYR